MMRRRQFTRFRIPKRSYRKASLTLDDVGCNDFVAREGGFSAPAGRFNFAPRSRFSARMLLNLRKWARAPPKGSKVVAKSPAPGP
jgi:hypothetical protein